MGKNKITSLENQETPSQSILVLLNQWWDNHYQNKLFRFGVTLGVVLFICIFALLAMFAIKQLEKSWYSIYFLSTGSKLNWIFYFIMGINVLRWLSLTGFLVIGIFLLFIPENSQFFDSLMALFVKIMIFGIPIFSILVGLQNLAIYNFIGWKHIDIIAIGEGSALFLFCAGAILVFWGSRFQTKKITVIFESLFNLVLLLLPIVVITTNSAGGFKSLPQWFMILGIFVYLFIFIVGVDELRGKPSIYTYAVTTYRIFEVGHASMQILRKRSAEALSDALLVYKRLTPEKQDALSKWILDSSKPSFINRFWASAKIVVSTIILTILVQEPAIIVLKWFLKTVFGFSY